jgi:uncharacterized protein YdhG (YjbR/CyaY superfamily)
MPAPKKAQNRIDSYIQRFPEKVQDILSKIRKLARKAAPEANEVISYGVPAFTNNGPIVYYAGFKNHVGIYPPVRGDAKLVEDLKPYAGPKGNLKFPLDEKIPWALIKRVIKHHVRRDEELASKGE